MKEERTYTELNLMIQLWSIGASWAQSYFLFIILTIIVIMF
jgi:hypothetical protein